jgi:hypothetical protein
MQHQHRRIATFVIFGIIKGERNVGKGYEHSLEILLLTHGLLIEKVPELCTCNKLLKLLRFWAIGEEVPLRGVWRELMKRMRRGCWFSLALELEISLTILGFCCLCEVRRNKGVILLILQSTRKCKMNGLGMALCI